MSDAIEAVKWASRGNGWAIAGYVGDNPTEDEWTASDELPVWAWFQTEAEARAALAIIDVLQNNLCSDTYSFHVVAPGDEVPTFGQQVKAWGGPEDWPEVTE